MSTTILPNAELIYVISHIGPLTEDEIYDYFHYKYPNTKNLGLAIELEEEKMNIEKKDGYYRLTASPEDNVNKFYSLSIEDYLPEGLDDGKIELESLRDAFALWFKLVMSIKSYGKKEISCWTNIPWTYFAETQYQHEIMNKMIRDGQLSVNYGFNSKRSPFHRKIAENLVCEQLFDVLLTRKPYEDKNAFLTLVGDYAIKITLNSAIQQKITTVFKSSGLVMNKDEDFSEVFASMEALVGQKTPITFEFTRNVSKVKSVKKKFDKILTREITLPQSVENVLIYQDMDEDEMADEKIDFNFMAISAANMNEPFIKEARYV